jgi:hypothetical protein
MGEYELSRKDGVRAMRLCPSEEEKKTILKRQILCREALDELGYEKDIWKIRLKLQASRKALGEQWAEQEAAHKVMQAFLTAPVSSHARAFAAGLGKSNNFSCVPACVLSAPPG